jgi:hypothetical protein
MAMAWIFHGPWRKPLSRGVIESGGQSSGFLILILFLISPANDGIKIKIKNTRLRLRTKS